MELDILVMDVLFLGIFSSGLGIIGARYSGRGCFFFSPFGTQWNVEKSTGGKRCEENIVRNSIGNYSWNRFLPHKKKSSQLLTKRIKRIRFLCPKFFTFISSKGKRYNISLLFPLYVLQVYRTVRSTYICGVFWRHAWRLWE